MILAKELKLKKWYYCFHDENSYLLGRLEGNYKFKHIGMYRFLDKRANYKLDLGINKDCMEGLIKNNALWELEPKDDLNFLMHTLNTRASGVLVVEKKSHMILLKKEG